MRLSCFDDTATPNSVDESMVAKDSGSTSDRARVIARYPNHVRVEGFASGVALSADQQPVVGDWVEVDCENARLVRVLERDSLLARRTRSNAVEPVAANLTQVAVVVAPTPPPDWGLADRYLAAAEANDLAAILVANKCDLGAVRDAALAPYRELGYPVIAVSAAEGSGLAALEATLKDELTLLVGQSGVGKSSLMNALVPEADRAVGALSESLETGRHTTSAAMLAPLKDGGAVIDAPGVRDFYPPFESPAAVQSGFREIARYARQCRFRNCAHGAEPGCAVAEALASGVIAQSRYASFRRLLSAL